MKASGIVLLIAIIASILAVPIYIVRHRFKQEECERNFRALTNTTDIPFSVKVQAEQEAKAKTEEFHEWLKSLDKRSDH